MFANAYDFTPSDLLYGCERKDAAQRLGLRFGTTELDLILALWAEASQGQPTHTLGSLCLPTAKGGHIEITPKTINIDEEAQTPEAFRASMLHMYEFWGGRGTILYDAENPPTKEFRMRSLAYAEVYSVRLGDDCQKIPGMALTTEDFARVAEMRAEVRAYHKDAPQERVQSSKTPSSSKAPIFEPV